jgi:hypothetical protein
MTLGTSKEDGVVLDECVSQESESTSSADLFAPNPSFEWIENVVLSEVVVILST